jgi:4-amino-4-deoxychorismate lyase
MTDISTLLNHHRRGILKLQLTRGVGGRGYRPPRASRDHPCRRLASCVTYPETYAAQGVEVRYCHIRLGLNPALAGIKHESAGTGAGSF